MVDSSSRPRLGIAIVSREGVGGCERRHLTLARSLKVDGNQIWLYTTQDFFNTQGFAPEDRSWVRCLGYIGSARNAASKFRHLRALAVLLLYARRDALSHLHLAGYHWLIAILLGLFSGGRCSTSISVVNSLLPHVSTSRDVRRLRLAVRFVDRIDCLSEEIGAYVSGQVRASDRSKVVVAPNSFLARPVGAARVDAERPIDVVMVSRFVEGKGLDLLEAVAPHLADRKIVVCGWGPVPPRGVNVTTLLCDDPAEILSTAKVFLSLQAHDNYPSQALLEAMACGCAIVATDVGLTRRMIGESDAVLIEADKMQLYHAIEELLSNPSSRLALAERSQEKCFREFSLDSYKAYFMRSVVRQVLA